MRLLFLALYLFITALSLSASPISQKIYTGPEIYHVKRIRDGGSWQSGMLYGVRFGWERIKRNSLYWCLTGRYGLGDLNGKTASGAQLFSHFTDFEAEGRLGYTLQTVTGRKGVFVPFLGVGAVTDTNHFVSPSPLTVQFHDFIKYVESGFLAQLNWSRQFSMGINFILKWMIKGTCNTSGDSGGTESQLLMTNRFQYAVELPFNYAISPKRQVFVLSLIPFYEYRDYGGRENFPYDFLATRFKIWGARLLINYQF